MGAAVQQGGLNSRESDARNVLASDVQRSMKDEYVLLLNLLPASSAVEGGIFPFPQDFGWVVRGWAGLLALSCCELQRRMVQLLFTGGSSGAQPCHGSSH